MSERQADPSDEATRVEEQERQAALARIPRYEGESAAMCVCGDEIPERRRVAIPGVRLCTPCQHAREQQGKHRR